MALRDIIVGIALVAAVAGLWWLVWDSRKKGATFCGRICGGCPHPCNSDGTPREGTKAPDEEG